MNQASVPYQHRIEKDTVVELLDFDTLVKFCNNNFAVAENIHKCLEFQGYKIVKIVRKP